MLHQNTRALKRLEEGWTRYSTLHPMQEQAFSILALLRPGRSLVLDTLPVCAQTMNT